jgi:hypothetical protein
MSSLYAIMSHLSAANRTVDSPGCASVPSSDVTEMAITWIFDSCGDRTYVQRQDELNRITVRMWSNLDQKVMIVRTDFEAVQLIHALEQEFGVSWMGAD